MASSFNPISAALSLKVMKGTIDGQIKTATQTVSQFKPEAAAEAYTAVKNALAPFLNSNYFFEMALRKTSDEVKEA